MTQQNMTQQIVYKDTTTVISKDGTSFVDYPNIDKVVLFFKNESVTSRELSSDSKRYRVYYGKDQLGKVFSDIDKVM